MRHLSTCKLLQISGCLIFKTHILIQISKSTTASQKLLSVKRKGRKCIVEKGCPSPHQFPQQILSRLLAIEFQCKGKRRKPNIVLLGELPFSCMEVINCHSDSIASIVLLDFSNLFICLTTDVYHRTDCVVPDQQENQNFWKILPKKTSFPPHSDIREE